MITSSPGIDRTSSILLDAPAALDRLQSYRALAGRYVLSVYLGTTPERMAGQAYWLAYRDACRGVRPTLPETEREAFEESARRAERYLVQHFAPGRPGLALFVTGCQIIAVELPLAPLDDVAWSELPEIAPLQAMLDDAERVAVVLFDAQRTRVFTVFLGQIETEQSFEDAVPAKQATGGWFGLEQTRFERHRVDRLRRHARHTVRVLMNVLRDRSFDRLLLAGPDEALAVLRRAFSRPLRLRESGTLNLEMFATDADVLKVALVAAEDLERREEQRIVDELLETPTAAHAVLGTAATLNALAEGSLHLLVIGQDYAEAGGECPRCERLVRDAHRCPSCGGPTTRVANLREPIVRRALAEGARVETVAGEAAERLAEQGRIGGWTRF